MPRIQFSDVTPPEKRSIRDIPISKKKSPIIIRRVDESAPKTDSVYSNTNPSSSNFDSKMSGMTEKRTDGPYEYYYPKNQKPPEYSNISNGLPPSKKIGGPKIRNKTWIFGTIIAIVIAVFIVSMMTVFASATISIVPKNQEFEVSTKIVATSEAGDDSIKYEVIKFSKSKTISVVATGEEVVETKASGKIVIYNNFSSEPQRLIVRTRFESPEGLIYRIPESVTIPGKSLKNGVETPGSIEVEVFADEAGEKYNIKKTDFTVPGFKTDANRYKNFYARSATDITGGFIGKMKTVLPNEKQTALESIESELKVDLEKEFQSKIPDSLVLLSGSIIYEFKDLPPKEEGSSVIIGREATAYAMMLDKESLSKKITTDSVSTITDWDNIEPIIKDFSSLSTKSPIGNIKTNEKVDLELNGKVKVWAEIDTDLISQRLLGVSKKSVNSLIREINGISSVKSIVRPVWKQSFPTNPLKLHVEINDN